MGIGAGWGSAPTLSYEPKPILELAVCLFPVTSWCLTIPQPYADPVHDPTWRWWEHKTQFKVGGRVGNWWRDSTEMLASHPASTG